jgi:hypothetical protein
LAGKDTNNWQEKERIQTIDREGYKPLAGKDTNNWRGKERIQTIGKERRGNKSLAGKGEDTKHGRERRGYKPSTGKGKIQTIGRERRGYKPFQGMESTNHWKKKELRIQTTGRERRGYTNHGRKRKGSGYKPLAGKVDDTNQAGIGEDTSH